MKKTNRIAFRVDDKIDRFLKSKAIENNMTVSNYIRTLIWDKYYGEKIEHYDENHSKLHKKYPNTPKHKVTSISGLK